MVLPTVIVDDPRAVIGPLCAWFYGTSHSPVRVFGVTGTNGKTSTAHFLYAGLAATGETAGLISGARITGPGCDLVPERTTPEAPTLHRTLAHFRREGVTACAMEISSHAVDQRRVDGIRYQAMAFTNLGRDHLDYHGTMESYYATKASLFTPERTDRAVVNIDDSYGARLATDTSADDVWTCSIRDRSADVYADKIVSDATGSEFVAHTPRGHTDVRLQTLGPHQVSNALVALTTLLADGLDLQALAAGLSSVHAIPGRCELVHAGQAFTAIVDYMHNTAGQQAMLPYLRSLTAGGLIVVAGATGGRDRSKRRPLGLYAATHADLLIITDESPEDEDPADIRSDVLSGARQAHHARVIEEPDRRSAIELAVAAARPGDVVVVAGRGSDTGQRFGAGTVFFDDHAQLHHAITRAST
jgi:UDP-N-acetylmuramoyl-L-alanyl-D-glutamate--2,6-diaminopimelate ligase